MYEFKFELDNFDLVLRIYEGESGHPKSLDNLDDEQIDDLIESMDGLQSERIAEADDINQLFAVGDMIFIGYDAEWVETKDSAGQVLKALSYQFYIIGVGGEMSAVFFSKSDGNGARLELRDMLAEVLYYAYKVGIIIAYPENIVLVGLFLRADLAMLGDLIEFKHELDNVGGSIATVGKPVTMNFICKRGDYERVERDQCLSFGWSKTQWLVKISFYDIAKHAPVKTPLEEIGRLLDCPKFSISAGYNKAKMDEWMVGDPEGFLCYGIRDAEIPVKYYLSLLAFAREHVGGRQVNMGFLPVSAGSLAVKMIKRSLVEVELVYETVFGMETVTMEDWDIGRGRPRTVTRQVKDGMRKFHEHFATSCYFGGRNECFYFGPTLPASWYDFDLSGAYTTGMVVIRQIDYSATYETKDISFFLKDVMGFAWVDFEFPAGTLYPCLPVSNHVQSLIFPLSGSSYCTAPELALANKMGAIITIRRGVIYPWLDDDTRVFQAFVKKIRELRKSYPKGSLPEQYAKLLGNSAYGKSAQGLPREHVKSAFNTRYSESTNIPESPISNGPMAAHITGFIRAVMGEIMYRLPAHRTVINCVTDGILTDATEDEIDLKGELSQRFQGLIDRVES